MYGGNTPAHCCGHVRPMWAGKVPAGGNIARFTGRRADTTQSRTRQVRTPVSSFNSADLELCSPRERTADPDRSK